MKTISTSLYLSLASVLVLSACSEDSKNSDVKAHNQSSIIDDLVKVDLGKEKDQLLAESNEASITPVQDPSDPQPNDEGSLVPVSPPLPPGFQWTASAFDLKRAVDFNRDNLINFDDLLILAKKYNQPVAPGSAGDANFDGMVDFSDLAKLAQNYNGVVDPDACAPKFDRPLARAGEITDLTSIAPSVLKFFGSNWNANQVVLGLTNYLEFQDNRNFPEVRTSFAIDSQTPLLSQGAVMSADGRYLVYERGGSSPSLVLEEMNQLHTFDLPVGKSGNARAIQFSANSKELLFIENGRPMVLDLSTMMTEPSPLQNVVQARMSGDGKTIGAITYDNVGQVSPQVSLWVINRANHSVRAVDILESASLDPQTDQSRLYKTSGLALSSDGTKIFATKVLSFTRIRTFIYTLNSDSSWSGLEDAGFTDPNARYVHIAFDMTEDGRFILSSDEVGRMVVKDLIRQMSHRFLPLPNLYASQHFSPNGQWIIASIAEGGNHGPFQLVQLPNPIAPTLKCQ